MHGLREREMRQQFVSCKGGGGRGGCLLCGRDIHGGSWMYQCCMVDIASNLVPGLEAVWWMYQCCMVDIASNLVPGLEAIWWRAEGRRGEHG